jgi:hypothetical protein
MPTYQSRVRREQEAARRAEQEAARQAAEDRFNEERRIYSEERRRLIGVQLDADKRERDNQQRLRKEERARNRAQRTQESRLLSPTSSRAIAKRKSGSSIGESGSGGEVAKSVAPKDPQGKGSRKGKGKAVAPEPRDPPNLPEGSFEVSNVPTDILFYALNVVIGRRSTRASAVPSRPHPSVALSSSNPVSASNARPANRNACFPVAPVLGPRLRRFPHRLVPSLLVQGDRPLLPLHPLHRVRRGSSSLPPVSLPSHSSFPYRF